MRKDKSAEKIFITGADQDAYFNVIDAWRSAHVQLFGLLGLYYDESGASKYQRTSSATYFSNQLDVIQKALPLRYPKAVIIDTNNKILIQDADYPYMRIGTDNKHFPPVWNNSAWTVKLANGTVTGCRAVGKAYDNSPTVFDYVDEVNQMSYGGFNDWQLPTKNDVYAMFRGYTGQAWQWAVNNGWNRFWTASNMTMTEPISADAYRGGGCHAEVMTLDDRLTAFNYDYDVGRAIAIPIRHMPSQEYAAHFYSR